MRAKPQMVKKLWQRLMFQRSNGHLPLYMYAKYVASISYESNVIAKVKVFDTDMQTGQKLHCDAPNFILGA